MESGRVTQNGTYNELFKTGTAFEQLVDAHVSSMTVLDCMNEESRGQIPVEHNSKGNISLREKSIVQLTEEEEKEIGNVGWKPYNDYFLVSKGYLFLALAIFAQSAFVILQSLSTYWLAVAVQMFHVGSGILVGVYAAISFISCFFAFLRTWIAALLGLRASKQLFSCFMDSVFNAPMSFFD